MRNDAEIVERYRLRLTAIFNDLVALYAPYNPARPIDENIYRMIEK